MVDDVNKDTHHGGSKLPCFERQYMIYQTRIAPSNSHLMQQKMKLKEERGREAAGVLPKARHSTALLIVEMRSILPISKSEGLESKKKMSVSGLSCA